MSEQAPPDQQQPRPGRLRIPTVDEIQAQETAAQSRRTNFFQLPPAAPRPSPFAHPHTEAATPVAVSTSNATATANSSTLPPPTSTGYPVRATQVSTAHPTIPNRSPSLTSAPAAAVPPAVLAQATPQAEDGLTAVTPSAGFTGAGQGGAQAQGANEAGAPQGQQASVLIAARGNPKAILVNHRQKGNPLLKHITHVPWEYGDVVADYHINQQTCILYMSMKYYLFRKDYIYQRIRELGRTYVLRVLLLQIDVDQFHSALMDLQKLAALNKITLVLCWSAQEAARYLETYKVYESKPADLLKEKIDNTYLARATDLLTGVKAVNKTDVVTLLSTFGSIADIMAATPGELALCPGFGEQKAHRLHEAFRTPFVPSKGKQAVSKTPGQP